MVEAGHEQSTSGTCQDNEGRSTEEATTWRAAPRSGPVGSITWRAEDGPLLNDEDSKAEPSVRKAARTTVRALTTHEAKRETQRSVEMNAEPAGNVPT
ncbi:hypothetical protein R1flu_025302 [Riccia fluitans]|uniref:Uncharacterized protein n=1 Tax=Riccia fluitans TaxID=41844 RepID=A0ABD1XXC8_9MARC